MISKTKPSPLHIRKPRTVTEIIKDSFHHLSSEARYLFPGVSICFGLICLSVILCVTSGHGARPNLIRFFMSIKESGSAEKISMIFGILAYLASLCLLTYVVNKILLMRDAGNKERTDDAIPLNSSFFSDFSNYILNFLIMFILYFAVNFGLDYLLKSDLLFSPDELYDPALRYMNFFIMSIPKILVLPVLLYLCFSALFVSLRDNISSTEAIKKVFNFSQNKLKKIWVAGALILLLCYVGLTITVFPLGYLFGFLDIPYTPLIGIILGCFNFIITYCFYSFVAFSSIIILGTVEDENESHYIKSKIDKIEEDERIPPTV